jgi:hypothetical protein
MTMNDITYYVDDEGCAYGELNGKRVQFSGMEKGRCIFKEVPLEMKKLHVTRNLPNKYKEGIKKFFKV